MAARNSRAELRERIVALVPENTEGETKEFFVEKNYYFLSTDVFASGKGAYIIVHASSRVAAVIVVLDYLDDKDQDRIYRDLVAYDKSVDLWVNQEFSKFFIIKEHHPDEITHLYERGNGRSIKRADSDS